MVAAAVVIAAAAMLYTGPVTGPRRKAMIGPVPANGVPERVQVSMLCHELLHQHSERSEHRRRHPVPNLCFRSCFALPSARAPLNLPPPHSPPHARHLCLSRRPSSATGCRTRPPRRWSHRPSPRGSKGMHETSPPTTTTTTTTTTITTTTTTPPHPPPHQPTSTPAPTHQHTPTHHHTTPSHHHHTTPPPHHHTTAAPDSTQRRQPHRPQAACYRRSHPTRLFTSVPLCMCCISLPPRCPAVPCVPTPAATAIMQLSSPPTTRRVLDLGLILTGWLTAARALWSRIGTA